MDPATIALILGGARLAGQIVDAIGNITKAAKDGTPVSPEDLEILQAALDGADARREAARARLGLPPR